MSIFKQINLWRAIARDYTLAQSVIPYCFAVLLASKNHDINFVLSFLGLIGVLLAHMSVNIWDDYFDWKNGAVEEYQKLIEAGVQVKTHKCFYLEQGLTSHRSLLFVALSMDAIAGLIGIYAAFKVGFIILLIAGMAAILGFFYSAPPFKFSYRGMSELVIGIIFGPLLLSGAYILACGSIDRIIVFASIIVGILVANISFVHCIMDFKSDTMSGKTSLATLMKSPQKAVVLLAVFYVIAYLLVLVGIFLNYFPLATALTLAVIPKNFALIRLMNNNDTQRHFWMGYLENWDYVLKEDSQWFMLRLCLSRNVAVDFILLLGIAYYLFS